MISKLIQYLLGKIKRPGAVWVILSGVVTAIAIMYARFGLLAWISLIPYFITLYRYTDPESGKRHLFRTGFLFGCSLYLPVLSFFYALYPIESAGLTPLEAIMVILLAQLGLSAAYSLPHGVLPCVLRLLRKKRTRSEGAFIVPLSIAALWVLVEWAGSQTWLGMPWGRLAVSQYQMTPLIQSAALLGSYFVSFLIVWFNALLAYYFYHRFLSDDITAIMSAKKNLSFIIKNTAAKNTTNEKTVDGSTAAGDISVVKSCHRKSSEGVCLLLAAIIFGGNLLYGMIALHIQPKPTETISVAVVQGNISSSEKWGDNGELLSLELYLSMTRELAKEEEVDLIVWTESCIPVVLNRYQEVSQQLQELAAECDAVLLVGAYYMDGSDRYNAVYAFYPDGTVSSQPYCKRRLVPFGEYMPRFSFLEAVVPALAELNLMQSAFTAGTDSAVFSTDFGSIGGLVCFDSVYEGPSLSSVRDGAELLALLSNDAWYDTSSAVSVLLGHAVLRAAENGRSIVRGANTGISAIIDANGRIQAESNLRTAEVLWGEVSLYSHRTLYSQVGNILLFVCLLYVLVLLLPFRRKKITEK